MKNVRYLAMLVFFLISQVFAQTSGNVAGSYATSIFAQSNFAKNPNAVLNVSSVTSTQGSTISRVTTTPLFANTEFSIADGTGAWNAVWATRAFDAGMKNRLCEVAMTLRGAAGGTTTLQVLQNAVAVFSQTVVLDATNPKRIGGTFPCGDLTYASTIDLGGTAAITQTIEAGAVYIGLPVSVSSGQITTAPVSYVPILTVDTGAVTNVTAAGTWARDGAFLIGSVAATYTNTSSAFTGFSFSLPTGLAVDTAKLGGATTYAVGGGQARDAGIANHPLVAKARASNTGVISAEPFLAATHTGNAPVNLTAMTEAFPFTFNDTDVIQINFSVPIQGWAATDVVTPEASLIEYASNSSVTDADDITSFVSGESGSAVPNISGTTNRVKRVRFQSPITSADQLRTEITYGSTGIWFPDPVVSAGGTNGINLILVNSTDVDVVFGYSGNTTTVAYAAATWATRNSVGWKWRVRKVPASGQQSFYVQGPVKGGNSGNAIPAGYVGEEISSAETGSVAPTSSDTYTLLKTITLTPGTWEVYGHAFFDPGTATGFVRLVGSISTASNTASSGAADSLSRGSVAGAYAVTTPAGPKRFSVASGATLPIYLLGLVTYTTLGTGAYNKTDSKLRAIRID